MSLLEVCLGLTEACLSLQEAGLGFQEAGLGLPEAGLGLPEAGFGLLRLRLVFACRHIACLLGASSSFINASMVCLGPPRGWL